MQVNEFKSAARMIKRSCGIETKQNYSYLKYKFVEKFVYIFIEILMQKLFLKTPVGFRLSVKLKKWLEGVKKKIKLDLWWKLSFSVNWFQINFNWYGEMITQLLSKYNFYEFPLNISYFLSSLHPSIHTSVKLISQGFLFTFFWH